MREKEIGKNSDWDRQEKPDWGSHRPASCSFSCGCHSIPPILCFPPIPKVTAEEGMKRLRANYTKSFTLTRPGKWRVETLNNFGRSGVRKKSGPLEDRRKKEGSWRGPSKANWDLRW